MNNTFYNLGINSKLLIGLQNAGFIFPTVIQTKVIPEVLCGYDIIAQAATGTGKTLAYALPLLQKIDVNKKYLQALILAPTHELVMQIVHLLKFIIIKSEMSITTASIIGNVNIIRQIDILKKKPHIIVASSGRILELIKKRKISSQTLKMIVLDEADKLLDNDNVDTVMAVIKTTLKDRQILLFSATITHQTLKIVKKITMHAKNISVLNDEKENISTINHLYFLTEQRNKIEILRKLFKSLDVSRALVFINISYNIQNICDKLNFLGLKTMGIHGYTIKTERQKAINDFCRGRIQLLIGSDLMARGLDIPNIDYIFNLDIPVDAKMYLHRVGRTGRAGKSGTVISIVNKVELKLIKNYAKILKLNIIKISNKH